MKRALFAGTALALISAPLARAQFIPPPISTTFQSPPVLGSVTPNAVNGTTIAGTDIEGPIGNTTPAAGAFTSVTSSAGVTTNLYNFNGSSYSLTTGGCGFSCGVVKPTGSFTGTAYGGTWTIQDTMQSTDGSNDDGFLFLHDVAPNGGAAQGNRVAWDVLLSMVGSSQGGSIISAGNSTAIRGSLFEHSNLGGTSTFYQGSGIALNSSCQTYATATDIVGCVSFEADYGEADTGDVLGSLTGIQIVDTSVAGAAMPYLGPGTALLIADQSGNALGQQYGVMIGSAAHGSYSIAPTGTFISGGWQIGTPHEATTGIDFSGDTFSGQIARYPFMSIVPLQANNITTATRLTSDGNAASSYLSEALLAAHGTGYTGNPSATITGCSVAPVVGVTVAITGGVLNNAGVQSPGSGCLAETTIVLSGGGGTGGAVTPIISGNTLNLPIKSMNEIHCAINARTGSPDSVVAWTIDFAVELGATSASTAIIGSPTWTTVASKGSDAGDISIAAPTADTSLGAVNITVTPMVANWNVGGSCTITSNVQRI